MKRRTLLLLCCCLFLLFPFSVSAHPGRTDANGGHYDRSTGEYHYHHGYPAHQHTNGVCPYDFDDKTGQNSGSSSSSSKSTGNSSSVSSVSAISLNYTDADLNDAAAKGYEEGYSDGYIRGNAFSEKKYADGYSDGETDGYNAGFADGQEKNSKKIHYYKLALFLVPIIFLILLFVILAKNRKIKEMNNDYIVLHNQYDKLKQNDQITINALEYDLATMMKEYEQLKDAYINLTSANPLEIYDMSADYLEKKTRPAIMEAKRIRELKEETKKWVRRAETAEWRLHMLNRLSIVQLWLENNDPK